MISRNTIDEIQKLHIEDVVRTFSKVELKKAGVNYRGLSPFTDEKTPSFYVVVNKNIFKDFSSGKGGGPVSFVMEMMPNASYPEVIREMAKAFNVPIEEDSSKDVTDEEKAFIESLHLVMRATARRYADIFWNLDANKAHFELIVDEILRRELTDESLLQWQIGYAPDAWKYLYEILRDKGFYKQGLELGLIKTNANNSYDVFRHRLMFPIYNERNQVVAFGGRFLPGSNIMNDDPEKQQKYINSPANKIFNKSRVLYGLNFAMHAICKMGFAYLVEGYLDVISMHQVGFINTVGSMGTSITIDQIKLLKRYTENVVLMQDGDEAGINSNDKNGELFIREGFNVDVVPLPKGKDPDDFSRLRFRKGKALIRLRDL